jgi:hypothetical protein
MMRPFRALSAHGHTSCITGPAGLSLLLVLDAPVPARYLHTSFHNVMEQRHLVLEAAENECRTGATRVVQRGRAGMTGSAILGALDQELMQVAISHDLIETVIVSMAYRSMPSERRAHHNASETKATGTASRKRMRLHCCRLQRCWEALSPRWSS